MSEMQQNSSPSFPPTGGTDPVTPTSTPTTQPLANSDAAPQSQEPAPLPNSGTTPPASAGTCAACDNTNQPARKKRSWCGPIVIILLVLALLGSLTVNCFSIVALAANDSSITSTSDEGSYKERYVLEKNSDTKDKIVVIPIVGTIFDDVETSGQSFTSSQTVFALLRHLKKDENVKGIILDINSPGGSVTASDKIYHDLAAYKKEMKIPIVGLFEDMACSGGYYVAMSCDKIVAHPTSFTGSIGVIMQLPNLTSLMDNVGVDMVTITSLNDQGKPSFKDMGSMYRHMRPEERAILQQMITQSWERFTTVVAEGRKGKLNLKQVRKLADGRVLTSQQALKAKLIDSIGYREDAIKVARKLSKSPNANIVRISRDSSFLDLLNSTSSAAITRESILKSLAARPHKMVQAQYLYQGTTAGL